MSGGLGEIETASFTDFRLHDSGNDLLRRIFYGDDVSSARFSQMSQAGVNGCRFPAAGRARKQQEAGSLLQELREFGHRRYWEIQVGQRSGRGSVEEAKDNFFARHSRIGCHSNIAARIYIS